MYNVSYRRRPGIFSRRRASYSRSTPRRSFSQRAWRTVNRGVRTWNTARDLFYLYNFVQKVAPIFF